MFLYYLSFLSNVVIIHQCCETKLLGYIDVNLEPHKFWNTISYTRWYVELYKRWNISMLRNKKTYINVEMHICWDTYTLRYIYVEIHIYWDIYMLRYIYVGMLKC